MLEDINTIIENINNEKVNPVIKMSIQKCLNYLIIKLNLVEVTNETLKSDAGEIIKCALEDIAEAFQNYIDEYKKDKWNISINTIKSTRVINNDFKIELKKKKLSF